jgi:hypothetical protein
MDRMYKKINKRMYFINNLNKKMKKFLVTMFLMLGLLFTSNVKAQMPYAVSVQGGYSWINGVVGGDVQIGHFGFGAGWMPTTMPLSGTPVNSVGFHATVYSANYNEFGYYLSLGEATNGFRYEDSWGIDATDAMTILMLGVKGGTDTFFWKAGVGYGWCQEAWTGEITLGIPLFKSNINNK